MTKNNLIVEFWQDDAWQKRVVRLDSSDPMFRAEENLKCFNLADWSFDDFPSSLRLYAKTKKPARGYWRSVMTMTG
jgi:hypothetical protein